MLDRRRHQRLTCCIIWGLFLGLGIWAQTAEPVRAERRSEPIVVDGRLSEDIWQKPGYREFWQREPHEGAKPTEKSEVWLAYDDNNLYIAARLSDSEPDLITALLGRRDDNLDCDWFWIYFDPYHDKRSGFGFGITPRGSVADKALYNDSSSDSSWDGIWSSGTQRNQDGWTVEIAIPFNQLRFKKEDTYKWGVHFRRIIKRKNETIDSVIISRTDSGFVSHFRELTGIENITPKPLVAINPYLIGKGTLQSQESLQGNGNMGLDAKIGLKNNLTLDLTLNPDFGQVEVDPANINLSAAETYYQEKRPFFIEGADIFNRFGYGGATNHIGANWGSPSLFYSRRIGRPPQGQVSGTVLDRPDWSTILLAAKITGTVGKGWKLGTVYGLTQREFAQTQLDFGDRKAEVEPLTHYGTVRMLKEFNSGLQGLGIMGTLVQRNFQDTALEDQLNGSALSLGFDGWTFLDKSKLWALSGWWAASRVNGSEARISDLQREYPHYYQRPDADHIELDPHRTHLDGWSGRIELNKERGNLRFNAALGAISPGFDVRDNGFQWGGDMINAHIMLGWRDYTVGKVLRFWSVSAFTQRNYNFEGIKTGEQRLILIGNVQFRNYWSAYLQTSQNPGHFSTTATRGGPLMKVSAHQWYDFAVDTDNRKKIVWSLGGFLEHSANGSNGYSFNLGATWKPDSRFSLSLTPSYSDSDERIQWVGAIEDETMTATFGRRYIFSALRQKTISCSIRLNWIFSPKLSLQAYIQPFLSVGAYSEFGELSAPQSENLNRFGASDSTIDFDGQHYTIDADGPGASAPFSINNPDFNLKSLRGTIVLRWEYSPGSSFFFVWTQNRSDYADAGDFRLGRDLGKLFSAPGSNVFMIKLSHSFNL